MKLNHTPAPWRWVGHDLEGGDYRTVIGIAVSCGQFCYGGSVDLTISEADKALIEAAPDMLALLIELTDIEGPLPGNAAWHAKVMAAIAKATGEGQ